MDNYIHRQRIKTGKKKRKKRKQAGRTSVDLAKPDSANTEAIA